MLALKRDRRLRQMKAKSPLNEPPQISKVLRSTSLKIAVSVKTLDTEQTASQKQKALRLFCRAMIRLYLQDTSNPDHGKRLGIL